MAEFLLLEGDQKKFGGRRGTGRTLALLIIGEAESSGKMQNIIFWKGTGSPRKRTFLGKDRR